MSRRDRLDSDLGTAGTPRVRVAGAADALVAGELLHRFNIEYDEPTPSPDRLARRIAELIESGRTAVLLAGPEPGGIAVLRFQPAIWSAGEEAYLAELYVVPERRRDGLGSELMTAALELCRDRGCDYVFLGTDEGDADAHRLYERFGFSRFADPDRRERMFVYEREL